MAVPTFLLGLGPASRKNLATCEAELREVIQAVAEYYPLTVIVGFRNKEAQDQAFMEGKSKLRWPNSKHNTTPSKAVDVAPLRWDPIAKKTYIDWSDTLGFANLAGYILNEARHQGVRLRWGGDWDSDTEIKDERFLDLVHFELIDG